MGRHRSGGGWPRFGQYNPRKVAQTSHPVQHGQSKEDVFFFSFRLIWALRFQNGPESEFDSVLFPPQSDSGSEFVFFNAQASFLILYIISPFHLYILCFHRIARLWHLPRASLQNVHKQKEIASPSIITSFQSVPSMSRLRLPAPGHLHGHVKLHLHALPRL